MQDYKENISTFQPSGNVIENSTYRRRFLEFFEPSRRSYVTNLFCYAVRSGLKVPESIIDHVKHNTDGRYADVPQIIDENQQAAEHFARYILHWESLTFAEKKAIKEEKGAAYREAFLSKQPPTDKQIRLLKCLGHEGDVGTKLDAMQIIDELLKRRNVDGTK